MTQNLNGKGYYPCVWCRNLESYWKNGSVAFFMCKHKPIPLKQLENQWRQCNCYIRSQKSPLRRKNQVK